MRDLRLVGLSEDGRHVCLASDTGEEFRVAVDSRLQAALRGDRARLGQLEIEMDSALRPRDIQARIRGGESPESVAQVAQVSVERIMGYAVPVLAERAHVAARARRCVVRRKGADGPGRLLDDAVSERLAGRNVDPGSTEWDAWRRDDGRWSVRASYHSGERERTAVFAFDPGGRFVVADDDEARWLVGEESALKGPQPRERVGRDRRLAAVPRPDNTRPDSTHPEDALPIDRAPAADTARMPDPEEAGADRPEPDEADVETQPAAVAAGAAAAAGAAGATAAAPDRRRKDRRRASVPSWDEIMFGSQRG